MIAAEYEAIQLYQQTAESTDNQLAREVLIDIANEEKEHAGEFLRLLRELDPEEENFYREGYEEVEEMIDKTRRWSCLETNRSPNTESAALKPSAHRLPDRKLG